MLAGYTARKYTDNKKCVESIQFYTGAERRGECQGFLGSLSDWLVGAVGFVIAES